MHHDRAVANIEGSLRAIHDRPTRQAFAVKYPSEAGVSLSLQERGSGGRAKERTTIHCWKIPALSHLAIVSSTNPDILSTTALKYWSALA